jgi:hypothetical protein
MHEQQRKDMRRRSLRLALLVMAGLLLPYLMMAVTARRPISFDEYTLYTSAIVGATVGHADEAGGVRALAYVRAALAEPALTAQKPSTEDTSASHCRHIRRTCLTQLAIRTPIFRSRPTTRWSSI